MLIAMVTVAQRLTLLRVIRWTIALEETALKESVKEREREVRP